MDRQAGHLPFGRRNRALRAAEHLGMRCEQFAGQFSQRTLQTEQVGHVAVSYTHLDVYKRQELGTIFQSQVAVKIVLLNNSLLGMVRQWQ